MGWRLRVVHTTEVSYSGPVRTSFNEVRMTPLTIPAQVTLESRVTAGSGVPVWTYCDYWGTYVSVFDISEPHDRLSIRAQATVETGQRLSQRPAGHRHRLRRGPDEGGAAAGHQDPERLAVRAVTHRRR